MKCVTLRRDGRRAVAGLMISLLVAAVAADLQLALLFSPLLILVSLISADPRVEAALIELVHSLGAKRPATPVGTRPAVTFWLSALHSRAALSPLESRAPPLPAV